MTPVPAPKKFWIFNGSLEQYPSILNNGSVHRGQSCTDCHGGDNTANSRELAHVGGFAGIATAETCSTCHSAIVASAADGLHTTLGGYNTILMERGFDMSDPTSAARFETQCTKCHTAVGTGASAATACGQCHISVPATAGGGLISGHSFNQTPSMDNNCTACHGSRVKDEYYGLNNELLERNKAAFDVDSPWGGEFALVPDVHKTAGMTCMDCHSDAAQSGDEMHGVGHPLPGTGDRYNVTTAPQCEDCHGGTLDTGFAAVGLHTTGHLDSMSCQVCHAQPYKNCFSCHTDETPEGVGFFRINGEDPTLADRGEGAVPDALMSYRVGQNPRAGEDNMKPYAVLRHVPVDKDVFAYGLDNDSGTLVDGIIPPTDGITTTVDMGSLPTWKYATPHTILRVTPITAACSNCHGADYDKYWLTDPIDAAQGWVPAGSEYLDGEQDANADITVEIAPSM